MDVTKANKWWEKAMAKEQLRDSHHPKPPKGHRFEVKTRDSSRVPTDGRRRETVMP
jgi:hypothetical protein